MGRRGPDLGGIRRRRVSGETRGDAGRRGEGGGRAGGRRQSTTQAKKPVRGWRRLGGRAEQHLGREEQGERGGRAPGSGGQGGGPAETAPGRGRRGRDSRQRRAQDTHPAPRAGGGSGLRRAPRGRFLRAPGCRLGQQLVQQAQGFVPAVAWRRGAGVGASRTLRRFSRCLRGLLPGRGGRREQRPRPAFGGRPAGPRWPAVGAAQPPQGPAAPAAAAAHGAPAAR